MKAGTCLERKSQSEEGSFLGSCNSISVPQQIISPSPLLVQSTLLAHFPHVYRLPSWFAILRSSVACWGGSIYVIYLSSIEAWQQEIEPSPPFVTMNSEPHLPHT